MRRILLFIGALVLLYSSGIEAKKARNKNQKQFWQLFGSNNEPATAAGEDLFLENEGSGEKDGTGAHEDDEDFEVGSGDRDAMDKLGKEDPDYYDPYDFVTEKPDRNTDDEDLYDGSGSGDGIEEPFNAYISECDEPKEAGPCMAYFQRWFFNLATKKCEMFIYGGCQGNSNNFEGQKECEYYCGMGTQPEVVIPLEPAKPDKNKSPCENLRDRSQGVTDWVPKCEADGKYARQQCSLVTEKFRTYYLCWCVDMNGLEINGTKLEYDDYPQDTESCDFGKNLTTCVFQLVQHSQGLIGTYRPICTEDGQYRPIQCQGSECWCVDVNGNEILGTFVKKPDMPNCGDNQEKTTMKPKVPPKKDNRPYKPFEPDTKKDKKPVYTIPEEPDSNVVINKLPDKIDIDSGEDVELVEERTNEINDKTVYANQVQQSQLLARPGLLAAIIAGAVVGLLLMVLLVMFIVYRMRKKDEGSYPLDEQKYQNYPYAKAPTKEFYA